MEFQLKFVLHFNTQQQQMRNIYTKKHLILTNFKNNFTRKVN